MHVASPFRLQEFFYKAYVLLPLLAYANGKGITMGD